MPTVLIVDDEKIFRKGLRHMLAGVDAEWIVVDEARDGLDALNKAESHHPDIIITDIRMPRMDGIELQYVLKERYPYTQCLVMSGYDDFEYVRNSFRLGAQDYLLKPVAKEDLLIALNKAKLKWEKAQQDKLLNPTADIRIRSQLRQHLLSGIITGGLTGEERGLLEDVGLCFPHEHYCCMIADLDRDSIAEERYLLSDPALFSTFISQFIQELVDEQSNGHVFVLPDGNVASIFNYSDGVDGFEQVRKLARLILKEIKAISNLTISLSIGNSAIGFEAVPKSFKEAELAILSRLHAGGNRLFVYQEKRSMHAAIGSGSISLGLLERVIQEGKAEAAETMINRLLHDLINPNTDPTWIQQQVCKLVLQFCEWAIQLDITDEWLKGNDMKSIVADLFRITERSELIAHCKKLAVDLCHAIKNRKLNTVSDSIDWAIAYVRNHYAEPVTLGMMAEKVHLNSSYFCTLFKNRTGESLIDFVTQIRIEEAKKLLQGSDCKIAAIAEQIGFINVRHFNRVFKAETGQTPKMYREQYTIQ